MASSATVKPRSSAGANPRKRRAGGKSAGRAGWVRFWPLAVCLAIAPFAVRAAGILALAGPKAFALVYPWVEVVRSPALHVPPDWIDALSQWIIYLQYPCYGALMTLTFRADRHLRAFIVGLIAHFAGLLAVVVLAYLAR
jgi:hypothetical protein